MRIGIGIGVSASRKPPKVYPTSLDIIPAPGSVGITSVLQPDGSYLVTKSAASSWNTTSSVILGGGNTLDGDFTIIVEPTDLTSFAQLGMDATVNGNHDNTTITVAMLLNGGTLYEYNEGSQLPNGPHAYAGATVFFMRRVGTTVTFWKGSEPDISTATLVFTSATNLAPPHFFATSFYDQNKPWKVRVYEG